MPLFDPMTNALHRVLDLRQMQHTLTASNLANVETPGFKAKVVEFDETLSAVMDEAQRLSEAGPSSSRRQTFSDPEILEMDPTPWTTDDNSVLLEREVARLQENSLMYRAVSEGLSRRLALLKYAASDGRR